MANYNAPMFPDYTMEINEAMDQDRRARAEKFLTFIDRRFFQPAQDAPSCAPGDKSAEAVSSPAASVMAGGSTSGTWSRPKVIATDIKDSAKLSEPMVIATDIETGDLDLGVGTGDNVTEAVSQHSPTRQQGTTIPKRKSDDTEALSGLQISGGPPEPKGAKREVQGSVGGEHEQAGPFDSGGAPLSLLGSHPRRDRASPRLRPADPIGEQRRYEVEDMVKMFNRNRNRPLSPERVQRMMELPRNIVEKLQEEFYYTEIYSRLGRRPQPELNQGILLPQPETFSDEDSDEVTTWLEYRFPLPIQQAKFIVTDAVRLLRLLILGDVTITMARGRYGGTSQSPDFSVVDRMIADGSGVQVVDTLTDVSVRGRSPKQDGIVFVLAKCCRSQNVETKKSAYNAIQAVCRTPTQVFQLIKYIEDIGQKSDPKTTGWGRGLRRAVNKWYNSAQDNPLRLAMHVTKYQQRHGWSHRDVIRLSHIKPINDTIGFIVRTIVKGMADAEKYFLEDGYLDRDQLEKVHKYLKAVDEAKHGQDVERTKQLIQEFGLVREQLRTEMLNEPVIWTTLLEGMPLTALTRNLGKMSSLNLFENPENTRLVVSKLSNAVALKKAKVHPFKLLLAHHVYRMGEGDKGKLTWPVNPEIVTALEAAFYRSFENVESSGKRILIALDISGSMGCLVFDTPVEVREAATVMAMVTLRAETNCDIVGFHHKLVPLEMFKDRSKTLSQLVDETHALGFGTTDCSKPMLWAHNHGKEYDAFIVYTDSETNSHRIPPYAALLKYRRAMNIPTAKLIVVGMTASNFTIAQPDDLHMLDVVGFDTDTPDMITEFVRGGLE